MERAGWSGEPGISKLIVEPDGDWSIDEVCLIVSDYFSLLHAETSRQQSARVEHGRVLKALVADRSMVSVEHKYENISAILRDAGQPYLVGYSPRGGYQQSLADEVNAFLGEQALRADQNCDSGTKLAGQSESSQTPNRPSPSATVDATLPRSELSQLVQECGDITAPRLGSLDESLTAAIVSVAFRGVTPVAAREQEGARTDPSAVDRATAELYTRLMSSGPFRDLLGSTSPESGIDASRIEAQTLRALEDSDPARIYAGTFAAVVGVVLRTQGHGARDPAPLETDVEQLPLNVVLASYCDFSASKAPSVSSDDARWLHNYYTLNQDMPTMAKEAGTNPERVQQWMLKGQRHVMQDLMAQSSFREYWREIHAYCMLTRSILTCSVLQAIKGTQSEVDAGPIGHLLMDALFHEGSLAHARLRSTTFRCCPQALRQLEEVLAWVKDFDETSSDTSSVQRELSIADHLAAITTLPRNCLPAVAAGLVAALPRRSLADHLDRALRQLQTPTHFTELTQYLEERGIVQADPQTVRNKLNYDDRFSWAGQGTWALREWGYPRAGGSLDVVLYLIRKKGAAVTFAEICEFMFVSHAYAVNQSSVLAGLRVAEGRLVTRVGDNSWDEIGTRTSS